VVLKEAKPHQLLSADHFTVDGTMMEAWVGRQAVQEVERQ
jgi:hypothetical protein